MPLQRLLNIGYLHARTLLVDGIERAAWADEKASKAAMARLESFERLMDGNVTGAEPDRDTWGLGPSVEAAQHAMMML